MLSKHLHTFSNRKCALSRRTFYFFLLFSLFCFTTVASAQTAGVHGKIYFLGDSTPIYGATVQVKDFPIGAFSDADGSYKIENLEPGAYTLIFNYVSYGDIIKKVTLANGSDITINVFMEDTSNQLTMATVRAERKKSSINNILINQREAGSIGDAIASDAFNLSPVKNTGEVLKKVTGASIQDNKFVVIRGLNDRYNYALINGAPLSSTETDRKAFAFDMFPSAVVENLVINKTARPDLPGEFAGGIIQLTTKDVPTKNFFNVSISMAYDPFTTFKNFKTYDGGKWDFLGIDDGSRAVPKDVPNSADYVKLSKAEQLDQSKKFNGNFGYHDQQNRPNTSLMMSFGRIKRLKNSSEIGSIANLSWSSSFKRVNAELQDYDQAGAVFTYNDQQYNKGVRMSALWNFSYKSANGRNKFSFKNNFNIVTDDQTTTREGFDRQAGLDKRMTSLYYSQSNVLSNQLLGEHALKKLTENQGPKVNWVLGFNNIERDIPDYRRLTYTKPSSDPTGTYQAFLTTNASPNDGGRFYSNLKESSYNLGGSLLLPGVKTRFRTDLKVGGLFQARDRTFDARVMGYVINQTSAFDQTLTSLPEDQIFSPAHIGQDGFRISESTNRSDQYKAKANLKAGYALFDTRFSSQFRVLYGLRIEQYTQDISSFTNDGKPLLVESTKADLLPSINFTWSPGKTSNFRLAASKTLSRPEFRELAPFSFFDFARFYEVVGNPNLIRTEIYNYDFKYEIFPASGELISFGAFYKRFINPIEQILNPDIGGGTLSTTYANANSANNYGCELEIRQKLSRYAASGVLSNMTLSANGALIKSKVDVSNLAGAANRPLQGQSPYILNASLVYVNDSSTWTASANVNRVGKRIVFVGVDIYPNFYEKPVTLLDLQVSRKINKKSDLKLSVTDLFHQRLIYFQNPVGDNETKYNANTDNIPRSYRFGSVYTMTYSYKF